MTATRLSTACFALLASFATLSGAALAGDKAGCKDPEGLKRFEGSELKFCRTVKYNDYTLPTGKYLEGIGPTSKWESKKDVQGKISYSIYAAPVGATGAEVFRNYRMALHDVGFQELFSGKGEDGVGHNVGYAMQDESITGPGAALFGFDRNSMYTGEKVDDGVKTYVMLYVEEFTAGGSPDFTPAEGQVMVRLDVIQDGELKDKMVKVKASDMKKAIDEAGRISLYGINFDFNKADIKPDSRPVLDEIGKFLKEYPDQQLKIVGHTDNVGGADFNMTLSQSRATAVVNDLVATYQIDKSRLTGEGMGLTKPIAANDNDDGRAKNRRVELVKR